MVKSAIFTALILLLTTNAFGGLSYSSYDSRGSVIATVEIEGKGIYNLVLSIQFLNEPYDKREYTSDAYEELINSLSVEWRGVALKAVLEDNKYNVADLSALEVKVNAAVQDLIKTSKKKHGINNNIEVVYSITSLYIVDTSDN
jgi:hypothetical protein